MRVTPLNNENESNNTISNSNIYIVSADGDNYSAKSSTGSTVASNADFATMMNTLNGLLKSGDVILIKNGLYTLTKSISNTNKDGITYRGEGNTILKASTSNTDGMLWIYSGAGGMHPANCIVENIIFDANFNTVISPTVGIGGGYNIVQNCTFINTMQYGLHAWRAHNFKFINNRVEKAQYGISTGADNSEWCSGGLIANNYITDSQDCGIKLRWIKDTTVYNNTIEVINANCNGIRLYHADGPTSNITVTHNIIQGKANTTLTGGVWVDYDARGLSSGSYIVDNEISGCYYGVYNGWNNVVISDNLISNTHIPIYDGGNNTTFSGNVIR
jgi:hypothetical protein